MRFLLKKRHLDLILTRQSEACGANWNNFRLISTTLKNSQSSTVNVSQKGPVTTITMNRPAKGNAMNDELWKALPVAILEADSNPSTHIIALAGSGKFFTAGTDLTEFRDAKASPDPSTAIKAHAKNFGERLRKLTSTLIDCQKPIVAMVHGRAIGIGVTMLALCDVVYASDEAIFTTPFINLGIVPECCSTYLFPKIMGYSKASSLLYLNDAITANQAHEWGLVTQVFSQDKFDAETSKRIEDLSNLPLKSLLLSKKLIRGPERQRLHEVNVEESEIIEMLIASEEMGNGWEKFFARKK